MYINKYISHPSLRFFLFATNGKYCRDPKLVKCRKQMAMGWPVPLETDTDLKEKIKVRT